MSLRTVLIRTSGIVVTGIAVAGLLAAPTQTAAAAAPASRAPQPCSQAVLDTRAGTVEGAAGTTYRRINFVNTGARRCTLRGWPRVAFRDADGHRIGKPASHEPPHPAHQVTIPAGGRAHSWVAVPNPGNFPPAQCRSTHAEQIRVTPPHRTWSVVLSWSIDVCRKPAGRTHVDAVHRGSP